MTATILIGCAADPSEDIAGPLADNPEAGDIGIFEKGFERNNKTKERRWNNFIIEATPYYNGVKIRLTPRSSGFFICTSSWTIVQGVNQYSFSLADSEYKYNRNGYYEGYVETGDNCGTIYIPTIWAISASRTGFNPSNTYDIIYRDTRLTLNKGE